MASERYVLNLGNSDRYVDTVYQVAPFPIYEARLIFIFKALLTGTMRNPPTQRPFLLFGV